jgi:hypothetical protein
MTCERHFKRMRTLCLRAFATPLLLVVFTARLCERAQVTIVALGILAFYLLFVVLPVSFKVPKTFYVVLYLWFMLP